LHGRASVLSHVSRVWILPLSSRGLQCSHVSHGSGSYLPTWEGSSASTCPASPNPAFLLGRAPALPRVPRLCILPPCSGGLRRCHMPHSTGLRLLAQEGSNAATCPVALCGSQTSRIKKGLDGLPMRLDSHVFKAYPHVTETPDT
jgi:hypothetical protein